MTNLLEGLNDRQREAVQCTQGPLLVRAGAGSGKTRVLTRRIAYLIQHDHVNPWNILALTFTNKAANEMSQRINKLLGTNHSGVWASNFHVLGIRILHKFAEYLGYRQSFTIAGVSTQKTATKNIIGKVLDKDTKQYDPAKFKEAISGFKNELITPKRHHQDIEGRLRNHEVVSKQGLLLDRVYQLYQKHFKQNEEMDFDDLIMLTVILFKKHPEVLHYYQDRFRYISVDEYQDTNHAQYMMVKLLADRYHNICAVGDENQSIYGWRGADIRNIRDFKDDYPHARAIYMEQNYRSTKNILGAADSVIAHNYDHLDKDKQPWTADREGHKVVYLKTRTASDEAKCVIDTIGKLIAFGHYSYSDFAILYRMNAVSRSFEEALMHAGMPYQIVGGNKFLDRKEIQDTLAYLSLMINPDDSISFERIVNVPKRGIGPGTLRKLRFFANNHHWNLLHACLMLQSVPSQLGPTPTKRLIRFGLTIRGLRNVAHKMTVADIMKKTLTDTSYLPALLDIVDHEPGTQKADQAHGRIRNLSEFVSQAVEFDDDNHTVPISKRLQTFLNHIQLESSQDKIKSGSFVTLMTIHAAKGLEYPVVFMVGMNDGIFPSNDNIDENGKLINPEERRVAYVGITRAEDRLYLTNSFERQIYGQTKPYPPSLFLDEINPKYMDEVLPERDDDGNDIV